MTQPAGKSDSDKFLAIIGTAAAVIALFLFRKPAQQESAAALPMPGAAGGGGGGWNTPSPLTQPKAPSNGEQHRHIEPRPAPFTACPTGSHAVGISAIAGQPGGIRCVPG
jgi:hypothetical protein